MTSLLIYDMPDDKLRAKVADICLDYGLDRIQYSAFLGLSSHLSVDAFVFSEPMVVDIKFGQRQHFHHLSTTGYALVMESLYEYPINIGCVVYPSFREGRFAVERDFHLIDDELRQWFIEERDEQMRMIHEEIDPGIASECQETCPFWRHCHPE